MPSSFTETCAVQCDFEPIIFIIRWLKSSEFWYFVFLLWIFFLLLFVIVLFWSIVWYSLFIAWTRIISLHMHAVFSDSKFRNGLDFHINSKSSQMKKKFSHQDTISEKIFFILSNWKENRMFIAVKICLDFSLWANYLLILWCCFYRETAKFIIPIFVCCWNAYALNN